METGMRRKFDTVATDVLSWTAQEQSIVKEKSKHIKRLEDLAVKQYAVEPTFAYRGVSVRETLDVQIPPDRYTEVAAVMFQMASLFPAIAECVDIQIDTQKLAQVLAVDDGLNPLFAHLPLTLVKETQAAVDPSQLIDIEAQAQDKDEQVKWASQVVADEGTVYLKIETTSFDGYPVSVSILDASGPWHTYVNPGEVAIDSKATLAHGIDNVVVEDAPTIAEIWDTLAEKLQGKTVITWSDYEVKVIDRTIAKYGLNPFTIVVYHHLINVYAKYNPTKASAKRVGVWWSWDGMVRNESLTNVHDESPSHKVHIMKALVEQIAGQVPSSVADKTVPEPDDDTVLMTDDPEEEGGSETGGGDMPATVDDIPF